MKKIVLGAVALVITFASPALAADLPSRTHAEPPAEVPVAVYNWTGWYVGANGGYSFGNKSGNLSSFTTAPPTADFGPAVAAGGTPAFLGANHKGGSGGVQVGYSWQTGNWLFGLETDIQEASIGSTSTVVFPGGGGIVPSISTGRDHIDWFGTVRGRAGITTNNVLFYGTGGLAYGGYGSSATNIFTPGISGTFAGNSSGTNVGWVAGAGVEWGFAPGWSVKGEYLHIDLGKSNTTLFDPVNFPAASATYSFHHSLDTVRVGINYRFGFGAPVVARY
jgi:outer membrane immunogenic protein